MANLQDIIKPPLYNTSGFTVRTCHSMISNTEEEITNYNDNAYSPAFKLTRDVDGNLNIADYFNSNKPMVVPDGHYLKCPFTEAGYNSTVDQGICGYCGKPITADLNAEDTLKNNLEFSIDKANASLVSSLDNVEKNAEFGTKQIKLNINYNPTISINETLQLVDINNVTRSTFTRN